MMPTRLGWVYHHDNYRLDVTPVTDGTCYLLWERLPVREMEDACSRVVSDQEVGEWLDYFLGQGTARA
jgi:hypothetical protein